LLSYIIELETGR